MSELGKEGLRKLLKILFSNWVYLLRNDHIKVRHNVHSKKRSVDDQNIRTVLFDLYFHFSVKNQEF